MRCSLEPLLESLGPPKTVDVRAAESLEAQTFYSGLQLQ